MRMGIRKMQSRDCSKRVISYYNRSVGYNILLQGARHFGYHPDGKKIDEKKALMLMQDKVGEKLCLREDMDVLDAGCGKGIVAVYLAKKFGSKIHGIDINPYDIKNSKKLSNKSKVTTLTNFDVMDFSNIYYKENSFDAVYALETLTHSPDIKKTLSEIYRVLRKGGRATFFVYTLSDDDMFSKRELNILDEINYSAGHEGFMQFRHKTFSKLLRDVGFKKIKSEDITINMVPSFWRLHRHARFFYPPINFFRLYRHFPNITGAIEVYDMLLRGLVKYKIFSMSK